MKKSLVSMVFSSLLYILLLPIWMYAQQIADPEFNPQIKNPMYEKGKGSLILIDEGHNNFHTMTGRYKPFADVLEKDGYTVRQIDVALTGAALKDAAILVISNALNEKNTKDWVLPVSSAFTQSEIDEIEEWVKGGGSLFLIADHMPFPGAAEKLAARFGFNLNNGFALDTTQMGKPDLFTRTDKTLLINAVTEGRNISESVDSVYSFTGEAFRIPDDALPLLQFNQNFVAFMPDTAWNFKDDTPSISVAGWCQGAVKKSGNGRIAVWGEAAMFSAQSSNNNKVGMNAPYARYNMQLLLNLIHWLDKKIQ